MLLKDFFDKYVGKKTTDPWGGFPGECVSLVKRKAKEVDGIDPADLNVNNRAKNAWLEYDKNGWSKHYDKKQDPKPGDIAVYDGEYGDVAIVVNSSQVFGQDGYPYYNPARYRSINIPGKPLGFLRLKGATIEDDMQIELTPPVFNARYYLNKNPDVNAKYKVPNAHKHWLEHGIAEGRPSAPNFHVKEYLANYGDLRRAYGKNYKRAIIHYFDHGINEGRLGRKKTTVVVKDRALELKAKIQGIIDQYK